MWVELSRASGKKILEKKPEEENLVTLSLYTDVWFSNLVWPTKMLVICPSNQVLLAFIHSSAHSEGKNDCNFPFMRKQALQWKRQKRLTIGPGNSGENSRRFAKLLLMTYSSRSTCFFTLWPKTFLRWGLKNNYMVGSQGQLSKYLSFIEQFHVLTTILQK